MRENHDTTQGTNTPPRLAELMAVLADIRHGDRVLVPCFGTGNLLRAIRDVAPDATVTGIESTPERIGSVQEGEADVLICRDFLGIDPGLYIGGPFDRILIHPSFEADEDVKHIQYAATMLSPGGRLVAICAGGPRQERLLRPAAALWEPQPAGTFTEAGTNLNTVLLLITRPSEAP